MKKVLAIILCLSLVFAFAACGSNAKKSDAKKTESKVESQTESKTDTTPSTANVKTV